MWAAESKGRGRRGNQQVVMIADPVAGIDRGTKSA